MSTSPRAPCAPKVNSMLAVPFRWLRKRRRVRDRRCAARRRVGRGYWFARAGPVPWICGGRCVDVATRDDGHHHAAASRVRAGLLHPVLWRQERSAGSSGSADHQPDEQHHNAANEGASGEIDGLSQTTARAITAHKSMCLICAATCLLLAARMHKRDHCAGTRQNAPATCSRGRPGSSGRRPYRSIAMMSALARGLEMK